MSSSEEDLSMLCEAVDPQFSSEFKAKEWKSSGEFSGKKMKNRSEQAKSDNIRDGRTPTATSHRHSRLSSIDDSDYHELGTTPEFRSHVAKKLSKILDSQIKLKNGYQIIPATVTNPAENYGVRLFASSPCVLSSGSKEDDDPLKPRKKPDLLKKRKTASKSGDNSSSSSDEMEKLASVAVSSDWVLSKQGVYDFSKPDAGEVAKTDSGNRSAEHQVEVVSERCGTQDGENDKSSSSHHRNVCRKKKHKDAKEKHGRDKKPKGEFCNEDGGGVEADSTPRKKRKRSKTKNR